jgi:drug/metabolite transporter (DMT)-like permease
MIYLSLSEATALNFLGPLGSLILTRCLSFATVQWTDCIGAVGALVGVVLVAQPEDIFGMTETGSDVSGKVHGHLKGLAFGVFGVCGGVVSDGSFHCDRFGILDC